MEKKEVDEEIRRRAEGRDDKFFKNQQTFIKQEIGNGGREAL